MRRRFVLLGLLFTALLLLPARYDSLRADGPESVFVTNFPDTQRIAGSVLVSVPIPQTRLETMRALVSPAQPSDLNSYTDAGTLDAAGFAGVTLGIAGTVQGRFASAGPIGVVLLPDVPEIVATFRNQGVAQFALRVEARAEPSPVGLFQSEQSHFQLGFPRYRVFLYNGTQRTAEVAVYAYLKSS